MDLVKSNKQEYEYEVIAVNDRIGGGADILAIQDTITTYASTGWRLITIFTNELGKNAFSIGNVGINSTVDQSILVFERQLKHQDDVIFIANIDILSSNIMTPFIPKSVRIFETNGTLYAILRVFCTSSFALKGLQGDLIVNNIFEDNVTLSDVCFFSFEKKNDGYYESTPFPISLPNKISHAPSNAGLLIKRYIGNEELVIIDDVTASPIVESQTINTSSFSKEAFLLEANSLKNAAEIYRFVCQAFENIAGVFTEEILHELNKTVEIERFYGNAKNTALKTLEKYLDTFCTSNEETTPSTKRRRNQ